MQKTKTLSQLKRTITQSQGEHGTTAYRPKGGDEQAFFDQHKIEVIDDANGNDDAIFKGMSVKPINRAAERHGYDHEQAKKVYDLRAKEEKTVKEETELVEGEESHAQFQKYHADTAGLLKKIQSGLSKHYENVTSKKGFNGGMAGWNHVSEIKGIHRQLQDIHDGILQQGEWNKPPELVKIKEEVELEEAYPGYQEKGKQLDAAIKKIQANMDIRTRGRQLDAATKKIQAGLDKRMKKEEVELDERTLSTDEMSKREDIVKGMKKRLGSFKARYGKDAKSVMYATATKLAKEETELDPEEMDVSLLELFAGLDEEERQIMAEMIENGVDKEIFEEVEKEIDNG